MNMIVESVFCITLIFELLLASGLVFSLLVPDKRIWPPPRTRSWQYWYIHLSTEISILCFYILGFLDWSTFFFKHWLRYFVSPLLIASGVMLFLWGLRTLTLNTSLGSKDKLIKEGVYRHLRNPQYLGTILFIAGSILLFNSLYQYVAGVIGIMCFFLAAFAEEPWLREQFKEEYDAYYKEVPRFVFKSLKLRAIILVPLVVLTIVFFFFMFSYLIIVVLGIPSSFALPTAIRFLGSLFIVFGLFMLAWLFRFRKIVDVVVSTYVTLLKAIKRIPLTKQSRRTEPLVILGPHRYIRHPIYFSVFMLVHGWWLLLDYTFLLFSAWLLLLWFKIIVVPFEEKELVAIFGDKYKNYAREVPSLIPFTKRLRDGKS
jgi:protein-S-isoprenylcysteine O-methyltransferase Ste14